MSVAWLSSATNFKPYHTAPRYQRASAYVAGFFVGYGGPLCVLCLLRGTHCEDKTFQGGTTELLPSADAWPCLRLAYKHVWVVCGMSDWASTHMGFVAAVGAIWFPRLFHRITEIGTRYLAKPSQIRKAEAVKLPFSLANLLLRIVES